MNKEIEQRYLLAKEKYARVGVDTDLALKKLEDVAISVQCWQGDDIQGFISDASLSGGIQVTGNYPEKQEILKSSRWILRKRSLSSQVRRD